MIKRAMDIFGAIFAIAVFMPLFILIAVLVRLNLGRPLFFCQQRPGLRGAPFNMWKFRTMTNSYGSDGHLLPDAQRLTRFGIFLRSSSLDELPELWNVLKGDMSLVGPRPLLMEYVPLYSERQSRRQWVRPGITGWAQINGRNTISWEEKFELDVWYVENRTLLLDIKILLLTIWRVIKRDGISHEGEATVSRFTGGHK